MPLVAPSSDIFKLWFIDRWPIETLGAKLHDLSFELLILLFIISIGILALKAFDGLDIEERVWTFVLCAIFISLWPVLVMGLKEIVDGINGYLVNILGLQNMTQSAINRNFFEEMTLRFSAPALNQADPNRPENRGILEAMKGLIDGNTVDWMNVTGANFWLGFINSAISILASASRLVIQLFFNLYFFLYILLGPVVIARGILSENLESFFELVQSFIILMLWPTMYVILAGFFVQTWSGKDGTFLSSVSDIHSQLGLAVAFIIMTLLVPPMTKKFVSEIGASILSPLMRSTGIALSLTMGQGLASLGGRLFGAHVPHIAHTAEKYIAMGEIAHEHHRAEHYEHALHQAHKQHGHGHGHDDHHGGGHDDHHGGGHDDHGHHDDHGDHGHDSHGDHGGHGDHEHHHDHHAEHHHDHGSHDSHAEGLPTIPVESSHSPSSAADRKLKEAVQKFQWKPKQKLKTDAKKEAAAAHAIEMQKEMNDTDDPEVERDREHALKFLTSPESDKMRDMEAQKIHHNDINSSDPKVVANYLKHVVDFHVHYGWLYSFDGHFTGPIEQRPKATAHPEVIL